MRSLLTRAGVRVALVAAALSAIASAGATANAGPGRSRRGPSPVRVAPRSGSGSAEKPVPIDPAVRERGIVLEVYPRGRTPALEKVVGPIVAALGMRGYATGPGQVGTAIAARLSRPARVVDHLDTDKLAHEIEDGYEAYLHGHFEEAVTILTAAVAAAHQNPSTVAFNQNMLASVQRALLGLAQAMRRLGRDDEAFEAIAEHLRSFPDVVVSAWYYSPEIRQYRQAVELELTRQGQGVLQVEVDHPEALIFVNEIFRGQGRVVVRGLLSGLYRVFVQVGREEGRAYDVSVVPGRTTRLAIDWRFDSSLETPPAWTGLALRERTDWQERAADYAARVGRAVGAPVILLVGPDWNGAGLVGTLVAAADGKVIRRAVARAQTPEAMAQIARFLAGESSNGLEVNAADRHSLAPTLALDSAQRPRSRRRVLAWASTGGAALLLATGAYALAIDGSCVQDVPAGIECRDLYGTRTLGIASGLAGLGLAGLGAYLFWSEPEDERPARSVGIGPRDGGLEAIVRVEF